ncbi:hypothetical protein CHGG_04939 [Chaetomium globosum CBS 148.51]|uniref:FAD-binding PCMH-type domain-containing protein n=1 Tax=Chaetomium globosum (strain ATCC 6205 / CBS 148.51 / DSM 1962 / NBRC 6347 / NRRL 1970) TaxID=306901 RepID=Q2GZV7_CHAGB|nr:uncharacterized protein CHGG_04939 [Chaetomium globosum CBS 148.51]EAQ88320.1 hypothetical protein CHGG_04939 [Chaetomium globosum CBS 148.51]
MASALRSTAIAALLAVFADHTSAAAIAAKCPTRFAWENAQLTDSTVAKSDPLFSFGDATATSDLNAKKEKCRVMPGDAAWPSQQTWDKFNTALGGALIETVPLAAPCYSNRPEYDAAACAEVTAKWGSPYLHVDDPTSVMWPLYQGRTCLPTDDPTASNCTLGGYAAYSVAVTKVEQIQLALNFARNSNLRLVVKNTGHDFADKSIGAGALSVWTHKLKDIEFLADYNCRGYSGPAFRLGSGVVTEEIYAAAEEHDVTVVGGMCRTVGIAGGYSAGGGHSPMAALVGMAADQILELNVVLPNGRFVKANEDENPDLYWALRGGGGSPNEFIFNMMPMWGANMTKPEFTSLVTPFLDDLANLGIAITPVIKDYPTMYQAYTDTFPNSEGVGGFTSHAASRLFPKENFEAAKLGDTLAAVRHAVEGGGTLVGYNIRSAPNPGAKQDNSVNPAWRKATGFFILSAGWEAGSTDAEIQQASETLTNDWMARWREVSPGAGSYMSEGDINEPDFQQAFYGAHYDRLLKLKKQYDPTGLFYAPTAVGSEDCRESVTMS